MEALPLETALTLLLADQHPALAAAHDELYPERVPEGLPLSLTLLYPFAPSLEVAHHFDALRELFRSYEPFDFELARLAQWEENGAVYAVPEPEQPLRGLMRDLWRAFPDYPPYGRPGADPPPHASLTLTGGDDREATLARAEARLAGLLPARFHITEVALIEESEPDRFRLRDTFRLGA
ncbi:MAG TPA: 2'-5' RNA ligase family protein [Gaiellaceae bacterium]|nr:2'-5' RNA ligase family protein [Gaiellaceae bacterium]